MTGFCDRQVPSPPPSSLVISALMGDALSFLGARPQLRSLSFVRHLPLRCPLVLNHLWLLLPEFIPGLLLSSLSWPSQVPALFPRRSLSLADEHAHFLSSNVHFPLGPGPPETSRPGTAFPKSPLAQFLSPLLFFFSFRPAHQGLLSIPLPSLFSTAVLLRSNVPASRRER